MVVTVPRKRQLTGRHKRTGASPRDTMRLRNVVQQILQVFDDTLSALDTDHRIHVCTVVYKDAHSTELAFMIPYRKTNLERCWKIEAFKEIPPPVDRLQYLLAKLFWSWGSAV